jgi:hypothetical protein
MNNRFTAMTLPALSAHTVLIDMDGTFTPTIELGDYFSPFCAGL